MPVQKKSVVGRNRTQKARPLARKRMVAKGSLRASSVKRGRMTGMRSASKSA